jgi:hypothetical protein
MDDLCRRKTSLMQPADVNSRKHDDFLYGGKTLANAYPTSHTRKCEKVLDVMLLFSCINGAYVACVEVTLKQVDA